MNNALLASKPVGRRELPLIRVGVNRTRSRDPKMEIPDGSACQKIPFMAASNQNPSGIHQSSPNRRSSARLNRPAS